MRWPFVGRCLLAPVMLVALHASRLDAQAPETGHGPVEESESDSLAPETLVFAASRYAQTLAEAPASVTIITHQEIERYGYRTLGEILGAARGFFTSYDRNYTYLTARGFARPGDFNTRILLMVDGHRLNDASSDNAYLGTEGAVDVGMVERVEIIRGPGSSLYGTNAFYAVVNIVTRQGRDLAGGRIEGEAASFGTYGGRVAYGRGTLRDLELLVSGSVFRSHGQDFSFDEFADPATNNGDAVGVDGDRGERALVNLRRGDWRAQGAYSSRRKVVPTASYGTTFNDPRLRTRDRQAFLALDYEHPFPDLSRVFATLSYNWFRYDGVYPYEDVLTPDFTSADWLTLQSQYLRFVGPGHMVTAGGELRWNLRQDQGVYDVDPPLTYLDDRRSSTVWAAFLQGEIRLAPGVTLGGGVRHDHYETFGGTTNPRGQLVARLTERTTLKALYGRAFRAPNTYENYYQDGGRTQKPAVGLQPEHLETFELSIDHKIARRLRGSIAAYRIEVRDLIGLTSDPADELLVFRNLERARSTGVELELEGPLAAGLEGRLSYAYQHAEDGTTGAAPINSPRHLARAGLSRGFAADRVRASVEVRHVGTRPTIAGTGSGAYTLTNATVLVRPLRSGAAELSASIYNLFGARYGDPGGEEHLQNVIAQDPRSLRIAAGYRF